MLPTQDYFVYQLSDGEDDAVENDTVFITINNDGPNTQTLSFAVDEGKELVVDSLQGILSVSSGNLGLPITAEIEQLPFRGTLLPSGQINPNGSFIYQHDCSDTPNSDYFLFKVKDPIGTFRDMNEAVMREVIGDRSVNEVLTTGRQEIASKMEDKLQKMCDQYENGIKINRILFGVIWPISL